MRTKLKLIKFYRHDNKTAILSRYNSYIRVYDGDNKEHFFRELSHAIKYLLDEKYFIDLNI